jgi:hypothetical protein
MAARLNVSLTTDPLFCATVKSAGVIFFDVIPNFDQVWPAGVLIVLLFRKSCIGRTRGVLAVIADFHFVLIFRN